MFRWYRVESTGGYTGNCTTRLTLDIQRLVGAVPDGDYGPATAAAVRAWQTAHHVDADGVWGLGTDGRAFPQHPDLEGVDYSFARPDPAVLYAAGVRHVGRYLWGGTKGSKGIDRAEHARLRAAGLAVWLIYEEDGRELLEGYDAGVRVATRAEQIREALGLPAQPIYFNVDFDAQPRDYPPILDALRGAATVVGPYRVGLYAGYGPIGAAFDADVIQWGFQTYAWSGGRWHPRAQLQQYYNGQWGGTVDYTRATRPDYGQDEVPG